MKTFYQFIKQKNIQESYKDIALNIADALTGLAGIDANSLTNSAANTNLNNIKTALQHMYNQVSPHLFLTPKEKITLTNTCFSELQPGKNFLQDKTNMINACKRLCDVEKNVKACAKVGIKVDSRGRRKITNPLNK